jgi:hypothetical protein
MAEKEEILAKMEKKRRQEKVATYASFFDFTKRAIRLMREMQRQRPWRPMPSY